MNTNSRRRGSDGPIPRRKLLAAAGALGLVGLSGCVGDIRGRVEDEAVARLVSTTAATPSFFYAGGENRTGERQHAETSYTQEYVPIVASGELEGVSRTVELEGIYTDSTAKAQDYNSVRSNKRRSEVDFGDDGDDLDEDTLDRLYEYLDDEPTVSQRFVVVVPDASVTGREESLADAITPERLLDQLAAEPSRLDGEGKVYAWGRAKAGTDTGNLYCWGNNQTKAADSGGDNEIRCRTTHLAIDTDGSSRGIAVERMGAGVAVCTVPGDEGAPSWRFVPDFLDDDDDGDGIPTRLESWGEETSVGGTTMSSCLVGAVTVQPPGCPCPMPALFHARRIRHDDQLLYVGGWILDDAPLYENSVTMLVADGLNDIVDIEHGDDFEAMRQAAESGFTRERGRFGSVCYDGAFDRESLAYLPPVFHEGDGPQRLASISKRSARTGRNPQTGKEIQGVDDGERQHHQERMRFPLVDGDGEGEAMRCLVGALDCPIVRVDPAEPCHNGCCCPSRDCECNWLPAMNGQSPR
ncbi:hypothetical protein DV706_04020 [Natronorubrum bangense]|uniref:Uncharacterized protein n=2 Tax=Natronorubrum bangense TaxID=61858 RepID=A0A4D6HIM7_9EURY|nr:hypothetical protein [Natronorubrum bangense]QCC53723.1 hypothetical protein DV706_04020 [Natronorubrum bangense]